MATPIEETQSNDLKILLDEDDEAGGKETPDDNEDLSADSESSDSDEADIETLEIDDDDEDESKEDDKKDGDEDEDLDEKVGSHYPGRPTMRQIKELAPELLKKFPALRDVFFREKEFTKIYPTVEDAREAHIDLTRLRQGEERISKADPEDFLDILGTADPQKETQFIRNFLPALRKRNGQAFQAIVEPVVKGALRSMFADAKRNGNANLEASALNAHEWLFGDDKIDAPAKIENHQTNQPDPEKEELKRRNQQILSARHEEFTKTVLDTASNRIKKTIEKNIPDDVSDFTRNAITKEVMNELAGVLRDDPAHGSTMARLLKEANRNNYSVESRDRILTAYLSRAITGIPSILKKVKSEALKGAKSKAETPRRPNGSDSRTTRRDPNKVDVDKAKDVKKGKVSELDFLNS